MYSYNSTPGKCYDAQTPKLRKKRYQTKILCFDPLPLDTTIVTTGGDHTSVEVIVGLIHTYRRDIQSSNNSVMDTIIKCPEAVIIGQ